MGGRQIEGSRAIITGASSGIGREIALALGREGARLLLLARREEKLRDLADQIGQMGQQATFVAGDVTDASVRQAALDRAAEQWGGLDILVNNAGVSARGRFADVSPERLRQIMEVNFFAVAEMIRQSLPLLSQGRRPVVVNVGSTVGHRGVPRISEYSASKFALRGLSEAIRPELAGVGVDLLLVSPGPTDTEFFDHLLEDEGGVPWPEYRGIPAEVVARRTVRAIQRSRHEIIPSCPGKALVWLNRLAPWLVDRMMKRYG